MGEITGGEQPKTFPPILDGAGVKSVRLYGRDDTVETETKDVLLRADTLIAGLRISTFIDDRQVVGRCYVANSDFEGIAKDAFVDVMFYTPIDVIATIWFDITALGDAEFQFFENANPTGPGGDGTAIQITNLNRAFATTRAARARAFTAPDFTTGDTGVNILTRQLIGGEKGKASIINQRNIGQFILLPGIKYLIRVFNRQEANDQDLSIAFAHVEALSNQTAAAFAQGVAEARGGYGDPDPFS